MNIFTDVLDTLEAENETREVRCDECADGIGAKTGALEHPQCGPRSGADLPHDHRRLEPSALVGLG